MKLKSSLEDDIKTYKFYINFPILWMSGTQLDKIIPSIHVIVGTVPIKLTVQRSSKNKIFKMAAIARTMENASCQYDIIFSRNIINKIFDI